LYTVVNKHVIL